MREITDSEIAALEVLKSTGLPILEAAQVASVAVRAGRGRVKRAMRCIAVGEEELRRQERTVSFAKAVEAATATPLDTGCTAPHFCELSFEPFPLLRRAAAGDGHRDSALLRTRYVSAVQGRRTEGFWGESINGCTQYIPGKRK